MAGVIDGQNVDQAVTNAAFIFKTGDDTFTGALTAASVAVADGSSVTSLQREHNSIASFVGKALNAAYNALPSWATSIYSSSHSLFQRVDALSVGKGRTSHSVTDGQAATNLTGETVDGTVYTSAVYQVEIIRGTAYFSSGDLSLHYKNSTWELVLGGMRGDDTEVTFTVSQTGSTAQLRAALSSGPGSGTIKTKRVLFDV
jgi:hypothetical protein